MYLDFPGGPTFAKDSLLTSVMVVCTLVILGLEEVGGSREVGLAQFCRIELVSRLVIQSRRGREVRR